MSHRERVRNMKYKIPFMTSLKEFRTIIRSHAERNNWIYYVVLHIIKRNRWVKDGRPLAVPKVLIEVSVIESNLPMPANVYNPIFKYRRDNKENPLDPQMVSYAGLPTPLEYFTLPEGVENTINKWDPVGEFFLVPGFLKWFDDMDSADGFITTLTDEIKTFLHELQKFVEENKKYFYWEATEAIGISKLETRKAVISKEYGVSSLIAPDIDNPDNQKD